MQDLNVFLWGKEGARNQCPPPQPCAAASGTPEASSFQPWWKTFIFHMELFCEEWLLLV